jgi:Leucine-rich repeat (LRR) protein
MCRNLNELELVNTTIRRLSSKLNTLPRLQNVYVYNNVIPGRLKLGKNEIVSRFVLRGIRANSLPRSYKNFRALGSLELSQNIDLSDFPRVNKNRQLVKLNLIENNITLAELKQGSSSLKELNLQKNKIRVVPAGIGAFPNLRKLGLNYNAIEDIHPNIGTLKKLESLSLYQNKLQQIPVGVFELNNLLTIDMYYNKLQFVGPDIAKLSKLQILYVSSNQLTALPEELGALSNLVEVYAHDNKLGALPESISNLKQLRVLRVNNNLISSLPKDLVGLEALENLDVSHNYLYKFPVEWSRLPQLKILGIMDNPWDNKEEVGQIAEALRGRGVVCLYSAR